MDGQIDRYNVITTSERYENIRGKGRASDGARGTERSIDTGKGLRDRGRKELRLWVGVGERGRARNYESVCGVCVWLCMCVCVRLSVIFSEQLPSSMCLRGRSKSVYPACSANLAVKQRRRGWSLVLPLLPQLSLSPSHPFRSLPPLNLDKSI